MREDLGLDEFQTRRVESAGAAGRAMGPLLRIAARTALRIAGKANRLRG
jgi:hypothetical protein